MAVEAKVVAACPQCGFERPVRVRAGYQQRVCRACAGKKLTRRTGRDNPAWKGTDDIPLSKFNLWARNAASRGLAWQITIHDVQALWTGQQGRCAMTGTPMSFDGGDNVLSLDRIDPRRGYEPDNVQLTTWLANRIRNDLRIDQFMDLCRAVVATAGGRKKRADDDDTNKGN